MGSRGKAELPGARSPWRCLEWGGGHSSGFNWCWWGCKLCNLCFLRELTASAAVWLDQEGSCPGDAQFLFISHWETSHRVDLSFTFSSGEERLKHTLAPDTLQCMTYGMCSVNICGVNKLKKEKKQKRKQQFTPKHCGYPHITPAHTHTAVATAGLIH